MITLLSGLALVANMSLGSVQGTGDRLPMVPAAPINGASCCPDAAAPAPAPEPPPPPQGTNKGFLSEPMWLTSLVDAVVSRSKNEGVESLGPYLKFGSGVSGAGWIAAGPGYRQLFGDKLLVEMSAVVSWRRYVNARALVELRPLGNRDLTVGVQALGQDWTQVQYYGVGPASREVDRSMYRLRATDLSAYATASPGNVLEFRGRAGMLNRPRISGASGWNKADYPDTQALFSDVSAPGLAAQPRFWHADVSAAVSTLDHQDHPTQGVELELVASKYDDRDLNRFSFRRYELSTVAFVPLVGNRWTIGARGMAIASHTSGANEVPFYMLPNLGQTLLRGFDTDRFRDRNLIAVNMESRWAIFKHLDLAVFADFGQVAPRFSELHRSDFESSYGLGLRLHTGASTFFRVDAARPGSGSGWKVLIKMYESLSSAKNQRWTTVVPSIR